MKMNTKSSDIFCNVIDNFGDIGVCWRLACQLARQENMSVTLWVDDLLRLQRLRPKTDPLALLQELDGFRVRSWNAASLPESLSPAEIVIEAFGCKLPDAYVQAMAACAAKPVWINLEYLSAEDWVEGCHQLPSPHPSLPLTKHFYFPGFTTRTGGLIKEEGLDARRKSWQQDGALRRAWFNGLGIEMPASDDVLLVSLFCYPAAPVSALFSAMQDGAPVLCLVPEGVANERVQSFLQQAPVPGARRTVGNLTVQVVPFLEPDDYDLLLWSCDLNFVRGEDSLVRAHWASRPFVWQLYEQEDGAHFDKLAAFFGRYGAGLPAQPAATVAAAWRAWNGAGDAEQIWGALSATLPILRQHSMNWSEEVAACGELAGRLVEFASKIG